MGSVQDTILLFHVWCESRVLDGRGRLGFFRVTALVEILCLWLRSWSVTGAFHHRVLGATPQLLVTCF